MRTAVVVGGGLGGLAVSGALARSGWQVTLLERADRIRPEPAAVVLWPNGVRALRSLGLGAGLDAIATVLSDGGVRRPDGHWLVQPRPTPAERLPVVVHREDLHDALIAGLGERVELRTGVTVRTVRAAAGERPAVGDGRHTYEADLVIAADGTDSVIRRQLAPASGVVSSGCAAWRAVIPWYRAPSLADAVGGEILGAGYRFVSASLGERGSSGASSRGGIYWMATAAGAPRPEPPQTQLALLRRWYAGWPAPVDELLAATEPADLVQREIRELRPLPRAFGFPAGPGGVVLLGDAAHAMPPHLGQGACLAFEDAATLAALLRESTLPDAVMAYDRARRPRAAAVVRQTRRMSAVLRTRGRLALRARDAALGTITPRLLGTAATIAAQWRPPPT
ncbi:MULTISPECIES: FAD-dependent monooxygenase [unclassified Micromonospora]|uniref:FAD-dependent oxidoreductase n=1 Tax=unclassified Micromonospora TaxID=2617518 RepID=UPI0022B65FD7|nr:MULTISPECIES: FAD-dependent monooxygenase [unclassified Micromonospora]MCZ7418060.1 FAD-dependent monooxygenase [Verrucosispora sp. WMMA2121]MCZ7424060.1 FAD-dependent monooxygenase [Verrucosispora sp. WMMA2121]WBB91819.1 FAD-dependent monooxygenase [Verrucosispora sp. WMMC514]